MIKVILHRIAFILTICLASIGFSSLSLSESILDKVIENKEINIGTREAAPPYAYIDAQGYWTGFSVEMSKAIVDVISKKVGVELNAKLNPVTPKTRIPLILNGTNHWNWGATGHSLKREAAVDFSYAVNAVCVKKLTAKSSGIKTMQDLSGKRVGVTKASVEERIINNMNASGEFNPPVKLQTFDKHASGFIALEQGKTDAHVTLDDTLIGIARKSPNPDKWEVTGPDFFCINQAMILPNNDSKWTDMVNGAFCYLVTTGEYDKTYNEWFAGNNPKAGFQKPQSENLRYLIKGQCPFKSETFLN